MELTDERREASMSRNIDLPSDQTLRMTYGELADRLGVSLPAAKMRAKRAGFSKNGELLPDGRRLLFVPVNYLQSASPPRPDGAVDWKAAALDAMALVRDLSQANSALMAELAAQKSAVRAAAAAMVEARNLLERYRGSRSVRAPR